MLIGLPTIRALQKDVDSTALECNAALMLQRHPNTRYQQVARAPNHRKQFFR
jgi:hypothetical protein